MKLRVEHQISSELFLSPLCEGDKPALLEYLQVQEISRNTLSIPYPYKKEDADWWINYNRNLEKENNGVVSNYAIRNKEREFMGCIGFHSSPGKNYKSELGYWLAQPYWGKGVMSFAVEKIC